MKYVLLLFALTFLAVSQTSSNIPIIREFNWSNSVENYTSVRIYKFEDATNTCYVSGFHGYGGYTQSSISCVKR